MKGKGKSVGKSSFEKRDMAIDKKQGIKENSKKDLAMDSKMQAQKLMKGKK